MKTNTSFLKMNFDEKVKRCFLPKSFDELKNSVASSFKLQNLNQYEISYQDDDNDKILIENEFDFEQALTFLEHSKNNSTLRIKIKCYEMFNNTNTNSSVQEVKEKKKYDFEQVDDDKKELTSLILELYTETLKNLKDDKRKEDNKRKDNNETIFLSQKFNDLQTSEIKMKCENCGRKFNQSSFYKHAKNCYKVFFLKRPKFDMKQKRMQNNLLNMFMDKDSYVKYDRKESELTNSYRQLKKAYKNWKRQSQDLREMIKLKRLQNAYYIELNKDKKDECNKCRRKFNEDSFKKHSKVCDQVFMNRRRPFDSRKQRMINLEHAILLRKKELFGEKSRAMMFDINCSSKTSNEKPRWKKLSDKFRAIIRVNRLLYGCHNI